MNNDNPVGWNRSHLRRWKILLGNEVKHCSTMEKKRNSGSSTFLYGLPEDALTMLLLDTIIGVSKSHIEYYKNRIREVEQAIGPSFPIRIWEWVCSGIGVIDKEWVWNA